MTWGLAMISMGADSADPSKQCAALPPSQPINPTSHIVRFGRLTPPALPANISSNMSSSFAPLHKFSHWQISGGCAVDFQARSFNSEDYALESIGAMFPSDLSDIH